MAPQGKAADVPTGRPATLTMSECVLRMSRLVAGAIVDTLCPACGDTGGSVAVVHAALLPVSPEAQLCGL